MPRDSELQTKIEGVGKFLVKLGRREFPCHGKDYNGNIYAYLADACRYLASQGYKGELSKNDYIARAQYWMGINESIIECRELAEKNRSWRWPTFPDPRDPHMLGLA